MRTKPKKIKESRFARSFRWHKWFAWHPVKFYIEGKTMWVWLEPVWRQRAMGCSGGTFFRYELIEELIEEREAP